MSDLQLTWINPTIDSLSQMLSKKDSLLPIFNDITLDANSVSNKKAYQSNTLHLENLISDNTQDGKDNLIIEREILNDKVHRKAQNETAYYLLQKYGCRVSSNGAQQTGASFFDDLRIQKIIEEDEKYLLIKGDLTGIQEFIYSEIEKDQAGGGQNISKRLRGKSFFVSLLTDIVANHFIHELGLEQWNILFAGGGHFNILVPVDEETRIDELNQPPNTDKKNQIDKLNQTLNIYLQQQLYNHLGLVTAIVEVERGKDIIEDAATYFKAVNDERDALKYKQHQSYLKDIFNVENPTIQFSKEKPLPQIHYENVGEIVPYADYLLEMDCDTYPKYFDKIKSGEKTNYSLIRPIFYLKESGRYKVFFVIKGKIKNHKLEELVGKLNAHSGKLTRLNDTNFLELADEISLAIPISYGFSFIGKEAPKEEKEDGNILEFEDIAIPKPIDGIQETVPTYSQLAAMRLDVDDLGAIFAQGLGSQVKLQKVAALSREMSLFFSGYVNILAKKYHIYVVYSGGDDAFLVGSWWNMIHFAKALYKDFQQFTSENPQIHFSAGIFLCNEHYPLVRFAKDAEELESASKNADAKKNKLTLFNHTLGWNEFSEMMTFADKLSSYTTARGVKESNKLTKSLVYRVLNTIRHSFYERDHWDERTQKTITKGTLIPDKFYRNLSNLHYLFARHGFTEKKIQEVQQGLSKDIIEVLLNRFREGEVVKDYSVALNYVLLKLRN